MKKQTICLVLSAAFLILPGALSSVCNAEQGFNHEAYLQANPDLPSTWGKAECINHYIQFGFSENRAVAFNHEAYLAANDDLPDSWSPAEALNHYNLFGKFENRILAFDETEYLSLYSDLPMTWDYGQALNHYANFGRQEGRFASFDEVAYLEMYADLPRSWNQAEAFYHYTFYGQFEGRVYDPYDETAFDDAETHNLTGNEDFDLASAEASDPLSGFRIETPASTVIPVSIDYSAKMPNVKSQGSTSSCTSWATGYYYKTYQEVIEEAWDANQNTFSPMYLYSLQCRNYSQPWSFIAAWETLNRNGCPKYASMPFVDLSGADEKSDYADVVISNAAITEAKNFRCGERNEMRGLSQVKQALTQTPVLLGINYYSNKHLSSSWNPSPENNYMTFDPTNDNVGHAVLCVGYDDSKFGTGALKFINSWGEDWAMDGFSWLRYSDYNDLVIYAMSIQDIPNANQPENTTSSPAAPSNVVATDAVGPYVDITWQNVSTAQYYRIFRKKVSDFSTDQEVGTAYQNNYRDYPTPGVDYYYSVVSFNDVGRSAHYASDTDAKDYVDKGSAKGASLDKPVLDWVSNDDVEIQSNFVVSNLATDAAAMEILVAKDSAGPWHSFGWADPGNFSITWGQDSEYIGKEPFVKIVVSSSSGSSEASNTVQVGETIVSPVSVAVITSLQVNEQSDRLSITWETDGGNADSFEIWRWLAAEDEGNEWVFIGIVEGEVSVYDDAAALPGKNYYYAVGAVYQGTFGEFTISDTPARVITTQTNLFLYEAVYSVGYIVSPANFELTVWNDGGTAINDYSITISVYDWDDGNFYSPFETLTASDYATFPIQPGSSQTVRLSLNLPQAYADGHQYSWIIELDAENAIAELYEDDNWIISRDWWTYDLSVSQSNLQLSQIRYNYGQISNPVSFELTVMNNGNTSIDDYDFDILAYDWDDGIIYAPFSMFAASGVALPGQLPLSAGKAHTLLLSLDVPSGYADGHYYSWIVWLDPNNEILETIEDDNRIQSNKTWWAQAGTLGVEIANEGKTQKIIDAPVLSSPTKHLPQTAAGTITFQMIEEEGQMIETFSQVTPTGAGGMTSSRPFFKQRLQKAANGQNLKAFSSKKEKAMSGPILFKKPSFCVDHEK